MGQILISVWPIWPCGTLGENYATLDANYSINHNSKVLIEDILDVDMCLSFQNLFLKNANLLKNKGFRALGEQSELGAYSEGHLFFLVENFVLSLREGPKKLVFLGLSPK